MNIVCLGGIPSMMYGVYSHKSCLKKAGMGWYSIRMDPPVPVVLTGPCPHCGKYPRLKTQHISSWLYPPPVVDCSREQANVRPTFGTAPPF